MIKKVISIGCILVSIALMVTPYGVAMTFAPGPTERVTQYYSYFSMMPFGYGNWFPVLTALLSIVALIIMLIKVKGESGAAVKICLAACIAASVLSWVIFNSISMTGVIIALLHCCALGLQLSRRQEDVGKVQALDDKDNT